MIDCCVRCGIPLALDNATGYCSEHQPTTRTIKCPFCLEEILSAARKCKHCGEFLDESLKQNKSDYAPKQQLWSPGAAAVLSLFIPGAGQIYKGKVIGGLIWLVFVVTGYCLHMVPGVILHIACIFSAYYGEPAKR